MKREEYLHAKLLDLYVELKNKEQLHLLDALVEEGWISPIQAAELKRLEEILNDNCKT